MRSPEHLALLKRGVEEWNAWRREHGEIRPELSGADLSRAMLRDANLHKADLRRATLREANLRRADLHEANLYGADLRGADLRGADLRGVIGLTPARLDEAVIDDDTQLPAVEEW